MNVDLNPAVACEKKKPVQGSGCFLHIDAGLQRPDGEAALFPERQIVQIHTDGGTVQKQVLRL